MGRDQPPEAVHQTALERGFGRIFAVLVALFVVVFWFSSSAVSGQQPGSVAANLLLSVLLIWQAARALRRPPSRRDLGVLAAAAGSLLLASRALAVPGSPFLNDAAYELVTPASIAWAVWSDWLVVPVPVLLVVLATGAWQLRGDLPVEQAGAALAVVACTSWAARLMRAGARRADADADVRSRQMAEQDAALAAEEAERAAANAVHDDVLSVLRAVSLADPQVPWSLVVSKARHAQDALVRQLARKAHGLADPESALRRAAGSEALHPRPASARAPDPLAWARRMAPSPQLIFVGFMLPVLLFGLVSLGLRWPDMRWQAAAAVALAPAVGAGVSATMLAAFRSLSSRTESQLAEYRDRLRRQARAETVSRADAAALDYARRVAGPVLDAVISSPVPDPDLRITAALASATLRDELLAPGFLTPPLADRVRATRMAGANIIIDFAPQPETGLVQTARELLAAALAGLDAGSHVTLQVHPPARERPPLLILHVRSRQSDHAALRRQAAQCGALISDLGDHEFLVRLQPRPMDAVLPVPGPPGQQVRGRAAAGSYAMQQGEQQEQDAREEDRAAGQHDPKHGEHRAGNQQQGPPAHAHGACEPHHPAGPGRYTQADVRGCVQEHPGPLLLSGATRFVVP
jgi:hypothetical protein